jgi:hypothetical protein
VAGVAGACFGGVDAATDDAVARPVALPAAGLADEAGPAAAAIRGGRQPPEFAAGAPEVTPHP